MTITPIEPEKRSQNKTNRMKLHKQLLLALAVLSIGPLAAHADDISVDFSFDDSNGLVTGDFSLTATAVAGDPGAYLATAGTLDITAPAADGIAGQYQLIQNPNPPNPTYSDTGLFIYDDLVMPGSNPVVTNPGLLAFGGPGLGNVPEGNGAEINFFSSGANVYNLYTGANGSYPYSYVFTAPGQGSVSATVVLASARASTAQAIGRQLVAAPEPSTWLILGSFLLIALGKSNSAKLIRE
jgi:hypothetical protein